MTVLILVVALLIGIILPEIAFCAFSKLHFRIQLNKTMSLLKIFRRANSDDMRQALLLRAGLTTLQLGLGMLVLFGALAAIAYLAPWLLKWDESQNMIYLVALSIVATGWMMIKHSKICRPL